ncbi:imidazolonepropionase [Roseovarius sp. 2305UL8-3]|uniref:imidazolonepropionase n=1 Tax=Roseovarius conchicola TaxID=3121636 RepID=UPI0035292C5A
MLLRNATLATMAGDAPYGLIPNGAVLIEDGQIAWVGTDANAPDGPSENMEGRLITPALIDCHTHIVHGGHRAGEFEMRLNGASYEEVARAGGGIVSTVSATREASEDQLLQGALRFVDALLAEGVSVIEVKSGYGLDIDTELKMLRAARAIEGVRPVRIKTSFLGAHAVPADYAGRAMEYIQQVCIPALEAAMAEGLVDAVDGFCEGIAFSVDEIEPVFAKAKELGLPVKLHAEQLSNIGGTQLAAKYGALSADHVEYATEEDARALAKSGSVAVILPGAFYTLREMQMPPIQAFRDHGVPMALATDCNPGSSPMASLLLTMNMGCTLFRMTPEEALAGVTRNAARALGLDDTGVIKVGKRGDLAVWDVETPAELAYRIGYNPLKKRIFGGAG